MTTAQDVLDDLNKHFDIEDLNRRADATAKKDTEVRLLYSLGFEKKMRQLFQVGEWISWKMKQHDASEKETEEQSFVIGQYAVGSGNPYAVAAAVFDRWLADCPDKPGRELGERLAAELLAKAMVDDLEET